MNRCERRTPRGPPSPEAQAAYSDIEKTLGLVPSFMKAFPEEAIGAAWEEFKIVQLNPASAIPPKYKELIGLAVAAQIPCRYCIAFHTEVAHLNGVSPRDGSGHRKRAPQDADCSPR